MCRRSVYAVFFFLIVFTVFAFPLFGQETAAGTDSQNSPPEITAETEIEPEAAGENESREKASGELLNLSLGDSSVSLVLAGRWKGTLEAGWGFALTPLGTTAITGNNPLFAQEGDLTLSLWMMDRWFVEASFMDNSALNTYRAGYQGLEGEVVRYAGIGNTGLDFPAFPYLDLGGDTPSSFGAYGYFTVGNLSFHSLIRYDAAAREEKTFVGDRERSYGYVDLSKPQRGISFVLPLPETEQISVPEVFIQDHNGDLVDSDGRRWRQALPGEYGVSSQLGLIELTLGQYTGGAAEPDGMIAVAYSTMMDSKPWEAVLGLYYGAGSDTFLRKVQEYFDDTASPLLLPGSGNPGIRLWDYAQPGQRTGVPGDPAANIPGTITIDGKNALVIYEPGTFSPFEKQNRYHAPVNTSSQASLVTLSTGVVVSGYEVVPLEYNPLELSIQNPDQNENESRRGIYELIQEGRRDRRSPEDSWPLADCYPELYLPATSLFTADLGLRFTNYGVSGEYIIGADVVPGSIQVYRNGILDPNFVFNQSSGAVVLANPAGFSEIIRISYLKQSAERRLGSLVAGIGAIWEPGVHFTGRLGLGLRWNVTSDAYTENGASSPGTVGLGADAKWNYDRLKAGLSLGLGFEQPDTTGLYRIAGMEENEMLLPLPPSTSFISEPPFLPFFTLGTRSGLIYRDYRETTVLGSSSYADISTFKETVDGETGPYPAYDSTLASQVLVAEFEFSASETWTGFQTPLGLNGEFLERAGKIEIPYRFYDFSGGDPENEISVIFQVGVLADRNSEFRENPHVVMEKTLYPPALTEDSNPPAFDENGRIATIFLDEEDRARLHGANYLRLLVVRSGTPSGNIGGKVILRPPIARGAFWRPVTVNGNEVLSPERTMGLNDQVNAYEEMDNALAIKYPDIIGRLHSVNSHQRVLEISWNDLASGAAGPGADGRIPAVPLSNYRSLGFFVRRPKADNYSRTDVHDDDTDPLSDQYKLNKGKLRLVIARGPSSLNRSGEIAMDAEIPLEVFRDSGVKPGEWAKVEIKYQGTNTGVLVENMTDSRSHVTYRNYINTGGGDEGSSYALVYLEPDSVPLPDGKMAIDEIFLEDSVPSYTLNSGASFEWTRPGVILQIKEQAILSDLSFQAAIESGFQGNPFEDGTYFGFGMNGRSRLGISLLGAKLTGNYYYSVTGAGGNGTEYSWSAGHSLFREFGPFSIKESFDDSPLDRTMNHSLVLSLNTRVKGELSGEVVREDERLRRLWQAGTGGKPFKKFPLDFSLNTKAGINEKTDGELANYAKDWAESWVILLPDSGAKADSRDLEGNLRIRLDTSPLGTELYFQGTSSFSGPSDRTQAGSLLRLDFPLKLSGGGAPRFLFRAEREYIRQLTDLDQDFLDNGSILNDCEIWAGSFGNASAMMFSIPFYSLFDLRMGDRMNNFASSSDSFTNSGQFADRFEFSLQQAMNYGISSLFLPRRFAFRLSRILEHKLDTPRDSLNLGIALNFSSINLFGAMGVVPLFKFYMGDEFSHSLETTIAFPRDEKISWTFRAEENMLFYGFSGAELGVNNTLTANSSSRTGEGSRWSDSLSASWTVPMEKSLLGTVYGFFAGKAKKQNSWLTLANIAESEYELLRKENLEFIFEKIPDALNEDYIRFSVAVGHESIVRIFGKLNLSVYGKLTVSEDMRSRVLSFLGTVGTSLTLLF